MQWVHTCVYVCTWTCTFMCLCMCVLETGSLVHALWSRLSGLGLLGVSYPCIWWWTLPYLALHGFWRQELKSLHLCRKHFSHWDGFQALCHLTVARFPLCRGAIVCVQPPAGGHLGCIFPPPVARTQQRATFTAASPNNNGFYGLPFILTLRRVSLPSGWAQAVTMKDDVM